MTATSVSPQHNSSGARDGTVPGSTAEAVLFKIVLKKKFQLRFYVESTLCSPSFSAKIPLFPAKNKQFCSG